MNATKYLQGSVWAIGLVLGAAANAIPVVITPNLTLVQSPPVQQNAQGPCVIGDPSCISNPTITGGFTTLPAGGNVTDYLNIFSPLYTVADVRAAVGGDLFSIGIDINQANNAGSAHVLDAFVAEVNDIQVFAYQGPGTLSPLNNPGTGFSDWQLNGFDLSGLLGTDLIRFGLDMSGASGGRDQFFTLMGPRLPPPPTNVPEPGSLILLGFGLLALVLGGKRLA